MSRNGTGIILSNITAPSRHFPLSVFIVLTLSIILSASGCTFLEQFKKKSSPAGNSEEIVDRRSQELSALEVKASAVAPEELGAARVVLGEMSYFESQGESEEVSRLDSKMAKALDSIKSKASGDNGSVSTDQVKKLQQENSQLQLKIKKLNAEIQAQNISSDIDKGTLLRRLEFAQSALNDAEQEVVRIRSRIQGMASQAEASAMFAEARVLIDRMVEEAYREQALEEVELAEHYLRAGKDTLDQDNPAGAAYLFDRVSEIYTSMIKSEPRMLTVKVRSAALRSSSSESSKALGYLSQGDSATGQKKAGDWVLVKTSSGLEGWIRQEQVQ
jgi:hypothetical protein